MGSCGRGIPAGDAALPAWVRIALHAWSGGIGAADDESTHGDLGSVPLDFVGAEPRQVAQRTADSPQTGSHSNPGTPARSGGAASPDNAASEHVLHAPPARPARAGPRSAPEIAPTGSADRRRYLGCIETLTQ